MNLDFVKDLFNDLKENKFVQNFINELSDYLKNNAKNTSDNKGEKIPIIEKILSERNVATGDANSIRWREDDTIIKYADKTGNNKPMYFVKDSKKAYWLNNERHYNNNVYVVLKVKNSKIEEIEINKEEMPKDIGVNDVFRIENGKYMLDNIATKELQEEITNMAEKIIDKQNINLDKYRKEGHLYMVKEELGNNRFLWDLTDAPEIEFEEANFPKELLDKATQGAVFKYTNGQYEYYSNDGFERAEKIHSSK